ncbi:hypothetical protein E3N88_45622 [Mikania micrantha]|uniref:Uncharacterized protein n=1 Tax=Mikania micrantha TaxID=192012 RepID=A0A5N6L8L9_9ASTR|nr:hypothetical protein E3N88_45622 [Mikania micrantha]
MLCKDKEGNCHKAPAKSDFEKATLSTSGQGQLVVERREAEAFVEEPRRGHKVATHHSAKVLRCGCCGYDLNLSSSARNTSSIGSKYGKSIKTGMISFFCIDETRFTQVDDFRCLPLPHFISKYLWRKKTKLLCRKCNNHIGNAYDDKPYPPLVADLASAGDISSYRKYDVRIRAVQPSSSLEPVLPLV